MLWKDCVCVDLYLCLWTEAGSSKSSWGATGKLYLSSSGRLHFTCQPSFLTEHGRRAPDFRSLEAKVVAMKDIPPFPLLLCDSESTRLLSVLWHSAGLPRYSLSSLYQVSRGWNCYKNTCCSHGNFSKGILSFVQHRGKHHPSSRDV